MMVEKPKNLVVKMPNILFDQINRIVFTCDSLLGRLYMRVTRTKINGSSIVSTKQAVAGPEDERAGMSYVVPADGVFTRITAFEKVNNEESEEVLVWEGRFGFSSGPDAQISDGSKAILKAKLDRIKMLQIELKNAIEELG